MKKTLTFFILSGIQMFSQQHSIEQKLQMAAEYKAQQVKTKINLTETNQSVPYKVDSVAYVPFAEVGTPILVGMDDIWSDSVDMTFNFCYFGKTVRKVLVGANGQLTFDLTQTGQYDSWPINTALPNTTDMPGNTICGPFRDIDPSVSGNTYYQIYGTAPNRIFIVSWSAIPLFDYTTACPGTAFSNFQIALNEGSNTIEVYINNSSTCAGWNGGYGIIGIQDATGTVGLCPPNRNFSGTWTAVHEGWKFSPISGPCFTTTGVAALTNKSNIVSFYPNPTNGIFTVETKQAENSMLEVYNSLGQKIVTEKLTKYSSKINLGDYSAGIYSVRIVSADGQVVYQSKIIKQ